MPTTLLPKLSPRVSLWVCSIVSCAALLGSLTCTRELTPAEKSFYERAAQIRVGSTLKDVKERLGAPSKDVMAEGDCLRSGGRRTWIYDTLEGPNGRTPLPGGAIAFCADRHDAVVAIHQLVY